MPDLRPGVADAASTYLARANIFLTPVTDLVPVEGGIVARTFAFRTDGQGCISYPFQPG